MTVADNVAFGLRMRRVPRDAAAERVRRVLDLVGPRAVSTPGGRGSCRAASSSAWRWPAPW
jgi:hypothetical protein